MLFAEEDLVLHDRNESYNVEAMVDSTNLRIWVFSYNFSSVKRFVNYLSEKALEFGMEKIIIPARAVDWPSLSSQGLVKEGSIAHYYNGSPMVFAVKYLNKKRKVNNYWPKEKKIINTVIKKPLYKNFFLPAGFAIKRSGIDDVPTMAGIFRQVFESYPTPLDNTDYLSSIIKEQAYFKMVVKEEKVISIAAAEIDWEHKNAEITNCATLPEYRGLGLIKNIINEIEQDLHEMGLKSFYTLARSISYGMNQVFSRLGYNYEGTLKNNCHICGSFEDMNLWSKAG